MPSIDLLDEDQPIAGQKFACISFVSPENILKRKEDFFFEEFAKQWPLAKSMEKFNQFVQFVSHKYSIDQESITKDLEEFCAVEKEQLVMAGLTTRDEYKTFIDKQEAELQEKFDKQNDFQTSTRGVKLRGCFASQQEAELRARILRENDPNHDVYVGPVGVWLPFNPEAYKTGRVEYMEKELNSLMNEKQKNETAATEAFEKRVRDAKKKAMEENIEKATHDGSKLTQTLNSDGDLVSVAGLATLDNRIERSQQGKEVTVEDMAHNLFHQNNIPVDGQEKIHRVEAQSVSPDTSVNPASGIEPDPIDGLSSEF